ncbi:hypothetical protein PTI98_003187 [Pleurotus ostreatus]|nr:hypothetical protein PTI98_003187 [Pleurotus ostreatus]
MLTLLHVGSTRFVIVWNHLLHYYHPLSHLAMANTDTLLDVHGLSCVKDGQPILSDVSFVVNEGDVCVVQGKSGSGKSTLLKCLAHLTLYDGDIHYRGRTPKNIGIPQYRTRVLYVPQRPSLLPGTPHEFLQAIGSFSARRLSGTKKAVAQAQSDLEERAKGLAKAWGVDNGLWYRDWSSLSGGESQRIALAAGLGCDAAEVLLLDEPTSALDAETSLLVEKSLTGEVKSEEAEVKAIIWITHSEEQGGRVGTRFLQVQGGICSEERLPDV